jgi:hypothetical protein
MSLRSDGNRIAGVTTSTPLRRVARYTIVRGISLLGLALERIFQSRLREI